MDPSELLILKAELAAQTQEIERTYERIDARARDHSAYSAEGLAFQLHNLYCGFEELFEIVARAFENHLVGDAGYHVELLRRMSVPVEGVRPAFIPAEALPLLDSLRSFRHFFRHAYTQEIDRSKLEPLVSDASRLRPIIRAAVDRFLGELA